MSNYKLWHFCAMLICLLVALLVHIVEKKLNGKNKSNGIRDDKSSNEWFI